MYQSTLIIFGYNCMMAHVHNFRIHPRRKAKERGAPEKQRRRKIDDERYCAMELLFVRVQGRGKKIAHFLSSIVFFLLI